MASTTAAKDLLDNEELFYLKWNNFQSNISNQFERLRENEDLVDITFACEGKKIGAHKLILFACSPYFKELLKTNCSHSVFFMNGVRYEILKAIIEYMYMGEVHLSNENLKEFIKTAQTLQIRGLTKDQAIKTTKSQLEACDINNPDHIETNTLKRIQCGGGGLGGGHISHKISKSPREGKRLRPHDEHEVDFMDEEGKIVDQKNMIDKHGSSYPEEGQVIISKMEEPLEIAEPGNYCHHPRPPIDQKTLNLGASESALEGTYDRPSTSNMHDPKTEYEQINDNPSTETMSNDDMKIKPKRDKFTKFQESSRACPVCSRVYSSVSNLRQHMRLIHNPTYVCCPICQKYFNTDLYLRRHISGIHRGENVDWPPYENNQSTNIC